MGKFKKIFFILLFFIVMVGYASATVNVYPVTAISDIKILPATNMSGYSQSDTLTIRASLNEITCGSFVINSDSQLSNLSITSSDFTGSSGTISASNVDIHWIKCWWQGNYGTAGTSLLVAGNYLTPELLLHDDTLINVTNDSTMSNPYSSNPNGYIYVKLINGTYIKITNGIRTPVYLIQDAATLQPLNLPKNYNKQVWITLTVPKDATAGIYQGTITLKTGSTTLRTINLNIIVLPITLPEPNKEYSIYNFRTTGLDSVSIFTADMQDILNHGVTNPTIYIYGLNDSAYVQDLAIRHQIGMNNTNIYNCSFIGGNTDVHYFKTLGVPYGLVDFYQFGEDESSLNDSGSLNLISNIHSAGGKYIAAQTVTQANSVADVLDLAVVSGTPNMTCAHLYHSYGHRIFSYANPQTVPEYPRTFRQNYGLLLWQNDYDGAMNYGYQASSYDPWNDIDSGVGGYRDHMFTYPTANGCIDTIQWEGFREAVNDVRYITALQNAILANPTSNYSKTADSYLKSLKNKNLSNTDLDSIRSQFASYIPEILSNNTIK
jgi:hypothetical protein